MEMEAAAGGIQVVQSSAVIRIGGSLIASAMPVLVSSIVIALGLAAWIVRRDALYSSASDVGYWLGVVGGSLMLVLLIYPLRKRFEALAILGPLKHWFRFHMFAGIAGPLIVLFHSTLRVGSFNAAIALVSMVLVVVSGLVGRVLYRKIHNGLYGSRATEAELQRSLELQLVSLHPLLARLPAVQREIDFFSGLVSAQPKGFWRRSTHFTSLGWKRFLVGLRVQRAIADYAGQYGNNAEASRESLRAVARTLDDTLSAVQRTAQFSTYERLFSMWHVVHIPFLVLLVITAIVHVIAVHAY
jgi:hypothetical protein